MVEMVEIDTRKTAQEDAVPWVLGNELQPHLERWRGSSMDRRIQAGSWVFLGLRGLSPESRMRSYFGGDETEMAWRERFVPDGSGGRSMGPAGPAGRAGRDRPAVPTRAEETAGPKRNAEESQPLNRGRMEHAPIGMFLFQRAAGPGSGLARPRAESPLAGILDGRTGPMASGTSALGRFFPGGRTNLSFGGADLGDPVSTSASFEPGAGDELVPPAPKVQKDGFPVRPHPSPNAGPGMPEQTRTEGNFPDGRDSVHSSGFMAMPFSRGGTIPRKERAGPNRAPGPRPELDTGISQGLGIPGIILSLLPGIIGRTGSNVNPDLDPNGDPNLDRGPDMPGGEYGFPIFGQDPNTPLPMRSFGRSAGTLSLGGYGFGPSGGANRNRPVSSAAGAESLQSDNPPLAHPRGNGMTVLASALEHAVARQVDKALKKRRESSSPPRPEPEKAAPAPDIESDRAARQLADRIRKLHREERFRRGQLR